MEKTITFDRLFAKGKKKLPSESKLTFEDVEVISVDRREETKVYHDTVSIYEKNSSGIATKIPTQSIYVHQIHKVFVKNLETGKESARSLPSNFDVREGSILRFYWGNGQVAQEMFGCENMDMGVSVFRWNGMGELINATVRPGLLTARQMQGGVELPDGPVVRLIQGLYLSFKSLLFSIFIVGLGSFWFIDHNNLSHEPIIGSSICAGGFYAFRVYLFMSRMGNMSTATKKLHKLLCEFMDECGKVKPPEKVSEKTA